MLLRVTGLFILIGTLCEGSVWAAIKSDHVYTATTRKTDLYYSEGLIVGGEQSVNDVQIVGIRHSVSPQQKFDRIVIDLQGNVNAEPSLLQRPPYFQAGLDSELQRATFTMWGRPKIGFDPAQVLKQFHKSNIIEKIELLPPFDKDRWSFTVYFRKQARAEVFELKDPVRIVIDLKPSVEVK